MEIKTGDVVRIQIGLWWAEGVVKSAQNMAGFGPQNQGVDENWYIEIMAVRGHITGYTYWKQGVDGGKVEVLG
jgi:hypothetical protein